MELLVISDTHGRVAPLAALLQRVKPGVLLFLGDGLADLARVDTEGVVVRAVRGNCDFGGAGTPLFRMEQFGEYRVFLAHGHTFYVKHGVEPLLQSAAEAGADAVVYGHTHRPEAYILPAGEHAGSFLLQKPLAVLCPGSLGEPRGGAPSFGVLTLRDGGILPSLGEL